MLGVRSGALVSVRPGKLVGGERERREVSYNMAGCDNDMIASDFVADFRGKLG